LAVVFVAVTYFFYNGTSYNESRRAQIITGENEWILQYDIFNHEDRDIAYTINVTVDGSFSQDTVVIRSGKAYTYIHHVYPYQLEAGEVTLALYEEGQANPVDQFTSYIDFH
jgi:hypothetical protein